MAGVIDDYLLALRQELRRTGRAGKRMLREAEAHLHESAQHGLDAGLDQNSAAAAAITLAGGIVPQANEVPEGLTAQQRARCATELQHALRQELSGLGVAVGTAVALLVGGYACVMPALAGIVSGASTYRDRKRLAAILVA